MPSSLGFSFYDTSQGDPREIFDIATWLLGDLCLVSESLAYPVALSGNTEGEEIGLVETNRTGLVEALNSQKTYSFYMDLRGRKGSGGGSFSYLDRRDFGGWNQIKFAVDYEVLPEQTERFEVELFRRISSACRVPYAIGYRVPDDLISAIEYANGDNFYSPFPWENVRQWRQQLPLYVEGVPEYLHRMRGVYPFNLISAKHLDAVIEGLTLREWIAADPDRGKLFDMGGADTMSLWVVPEGVVDGIAARCGKAGLLIAWKVASENVQARRRLP